MSANCHAYATVLRPSVVCLSVCDVMYCGETVHPRLLLDSLLRSSTVGYPVATAWLLAFKDSVWH